MPLARSISVSSSVPKCTLAPSLASIRETPGSSEIGEYHISPKRGWTHDVNRSAQYASAFCAASVRSLPQPRVEKRRAAQLTRNPARKPIGVITDIFSVERKRTTGPRVDDVLGLLLQTAPVVPSKSHHYNISGLPARDVYHEMIFRPLVGLVVQALFFVTYGAPTVRALDRFGSILFPRLRVFDCFLPFSHRQMNSVRIGLMSCHLCAWRCLS